MCLAIPAKLESVDPFQDPLFKTGKISFGGVYRKVSLAMLTDAKPGDYILVHAGVALSIISEEDAMAVYEYLKNSEDLEDPL